MFTKGLSTAALALAATTLVSAQTFTDCDPREKRCPAAPALAKTVNIDFTKSKGDDYLHTLDGTKVNYDNEKGAVFSISKETEAPTKASDKYIFFGELECTVQAAPGPGIVTSIVLQSDDLDEIDWEWVGGDNKQVQSNYFSKGDDGTYDRGGYHDVENPLGQFHTYGIVWTKEQIDWTIDGVSIRTLTYADADSGKKYPQSPMQIKIGTWTAGRKDAPKGTVEWAGGYADFSKGPSIGYYKNCKIVDYAGGVKGAKEYAYPDGYDGMWESVIIKTDGGDDDDKSSSSKTSSTTKTQTSSAASSSEASESDSATTLTTSVATSSVAASETPSSTESGADSDSATQSSPSTVPTDESAANVLSRANMALGVAGLFFAFML